RRPLPQRRDDLGISWWEDVLKPPEPGLGDRVEKRYGIVDLAEYPGGVHAEPGGVARSFARCEQPFGAVVERQRDWDLEPSPSCSVELADLLPHAFRRHRAWRVSDDRGRGHRARFAAEVSCDRDPRASREEVMHREIDDRERAQADAAAQTGEVRTLATEEDGSR